MRLLEKPEIVLQFHNIAKNRNDSRHSVCSLFYLRLLKMHEWHSLLVLQMSHLLKSID